MKINNNILGNAARSTYIGSKIVAHFMKERLIDLPALVAWRIFEVIREDVAKIREDVSKASKKTLRAIFPHDAMVKDCSIDLNVEILNYNISRKIVSSTKEAQETFEKVQKNKVTYCDIELEKHPIDAKQRIISTIRIATKTLELTNEQKFGLKSSIKQNVPKAKTAKITFDNTKGYYGLPSLL